MQVVQTRIRERFKKGKIMISMMKRMSAKAEPGQDLQGAVRAARMAAGLEPGQSQASDNATHRMEARMKMHQGGPRDLKQAMQQHGYSVDGGVYSSLFERPTALQVRALLRSTACFWFCCLFLVLLPMLPPPLFLR
jgi:hypothetical protein